MTKYILAGGADRKYPLFAKNLVAEISKDKLRKPRILSCLFAEPRETWESKFDVRLQWFADLFGPDVMVGLALPDTFEDQIRNSDVIYLHGGITARLLDALPDFDKTRLSFADKIVVGSSAGANYLSKAGYSPSANKFISGSGIVGMNVIVHYGALEIEGVQRTAEDWARIQQNFEEFVGTGEEITPLREGEFVVVEQ